MNGVERRFCRECGNPLWQPCAKCGAQATTAEKFCGECGADLAEGLQLRMEQISGELENADRLAAQGRFQDALNVLAPIVKLEHPRFEELVQRAAEEIGRITADQERAAADVEPALEEARRRIKAGDRSGAVRRLKEIPASLRTPEIESLLADEEVRLSEISTLSAELRSMDGRFSLEQLDKLGRLLELYPNHPQGMEMAWRICRRVFESAQAAFAECRYAKTSKLLDRLPPAVRTPEIETLRKRAMEIQYLVQVLRTSAWVDKQLVALAGRLRKLSPTDKAIRSYCDEIFRRARVAPQPPRFAVPWMAPPAKGATPCPLESPAGFQRIACPADFNPAALLENPGRFYVACGLALQGIGRAAAAINLAPPEPGLRRRVGQWVRRARGGKTAWGLDLGRSGLKVVKLVADDEENPVLEVCDLVEHRKPLSQALGEDEERAILTETLSLFLSRHDPQSDRICLGLPAGLFLLRHVKMPKMDRIRMARAVALEAGNHFTPLDQFLWGFWVLREEQPAPITHRRAGAAQESEEARGGRCEVAIVGARRLPIIDLVRKFEASGLRADVVQCDSLALHNYLVYDRLSPTSGARPVARPVAAFDLGCASTELVVSGLDFVWFRSVSIGSDRINQVLVRYLRWTIAQAEQAKRAPAASTNVAEMYDLMTPVFDEFAGELDTSLAALKSIFGAVALERILAVGGGIQVPGMLGRLQRAKQDGE